jgi:hypothetical protein
VEVAEPVEMELRVAPEETKWPQLAAEELGLNTFLQRCR